MTDSCSRTCHSNGNAHIHLITSQNPAIRRVLYWSLGINATMALATLVAGWNIASTAVLMDSNDFMGDALMYAVSIWAMHQHQHVQQRTAHIKIGLMVAIAGIAVYHMVINQQQGTNPVGEWMLAIACASMLANGLVLWMLRPFKAHSANIYSAWICSQNDLMLGGAIAVSAILTLYTQSNVPDLVVASAMVAATLFSVLKYIKFQLDKFSGSHYH